MDLEELYQCKEEIELNSHCPYKLDCSKCKSICKDKEEYDKILANIKTEEKKPRVFLVADLHLFHKNIIDYCNRPFATVDEMNNAIIKNWNKQVKNNDIVYVLGDYALSHGDKDRLAAITQSLNGRKILIMGNHDTKPVQYYLDIGFIQATRKPILYSSKVVLMHEPPKKEDIIDGLYYIFGHVHNKFCEADHHKNCFCVSIERLDYTLLDMNTLIAYLTKLPLTKYSKAEIDKIKQIQKVALASKLTY